MPPTISVPIRLDPDTAVRARLEAKRCDLSLGEWIAMVLRRELRRSGDADALAARSYQLAVATAHLLHALMLETLGPEATALALRRAIDAAAETTARDLAHAKELAP